MPARPIQEAKTIPPTGPTQAELLPGRSRAGRGRPVILAAFAAFLGAFPLLGQYPRARIGDFEVRGLDFAVDGGWRLKAGRVMADRVALLQGRAFARLNAGGPGGLAVRGNFFIPVLPIAYRDVDPPFPASQYHDLLFSPAPAIRPWSVKSYYAMQSRGNIVLDGAVLDWTRVDSASTYYQDGCNGVGVLAACPARARR